MIKRTSLWIIASLALVACGDTPEGAPLDSTESVPPPGSSEVSPDAPTFFRDVYPIVQTKCAGCHAEGKIAGFSLSEPEAAQPLAGLMAAHTESRVMPPWLPSDLSPEIIGDRSLSEAQIQVFAAWAEAGAPVGDLNDKPEGLIPEDAFDLKDPGLTFTLPEAYAPDTSLTDDYRCFVVPLDVHEDRANIGLRVTPGNPAIVHHVIATLYRGEDLPKLQALDAETPDRPGWQCFGGNAVDETGALPVGSLGSWVPGVLGQKTAPGTERPFPADSVAVIQVHYNTARYDGKSADQSKFEVFFAPPEQAASLDPLRAIPLRSKDINIAYGQKDVEVTVTHTANEWTLGKLDKAPPGSEVYVVGAGAHGHNLMTGHRITVNKGAPDERMLLDIPAWNFHWQGTYQYVSRIPIKTTDTLTLSCTYDNTPEHRSAVGLDPNDMTTVTWGEATTDEMCIGGLEIVVKAPSAGAP
jgi:hypothetical protein